MSKHDHLTLVRLTKHYGGVTAVDDVSLEVAEGEFLSLLGPSGCGKTTTLRMVAGFVLPTSGDILLDGRSIARLPPYRRGMGMVFQNYALFPHLNVADNVGFGLEMARVPKRTAAQRVEAALARVHLEGYGKRRTRELSGGQQQRVALARALVIEPAVLLLDEPLSNLDAKLREELRQEIREIQQDLGITTLFVTHDQVEALTMSDRIAVLNEGRVEQIGTPEEVYERPASRFVADFLGRANFLHAAVVAAEGDQTRIRLDGGGESLVSGRADDRRQLVVMVRPHRIQIHPVNGASDAAHAISGEVRSTTYLGDVIQYQVALGRDSVMVEHPSAGPGEARFHAGDRVHLAWEPGDALVLDAH